MVYVIDSNILVTSRNIYFPVDENTGFWEWLIMLAREGDLIVPEKVYEEMGKGNDDIPDWLNQNKAILWRPTSSCRKELRLVIQAYESVWGSSGCVTSG